jgi:hypothetical protein
MHTKAAIEPTTTRLPVFELWVANWTLGKKFKRGQNIKSGEKKIINKYK